MEASITGIKGQCIPTVEEEPRIFGNSTLLIIREGGRVVAALNSNPPAAIATQLEVHVPEIARRMRSETHLFEHLAVEESRRRHGFGRALVREAERQLGQAPGVPEVRLR